MLTRMAAAASVMVAAAGFAQAVDTSFTYQGVLQDGGVPASGQYDIWFYLYDAEVGGTQLSFDDNQDEQVVDGRFTVELDFGNLMQDGEERWVEIWVKPWNGVTWTLLTPRQQVTATPHAQHAETSDLLQTRFSNGVLGIESFVNSEAGNLLMRRDDGTVVVNFGPDAGSPSGGEVKFYNNSGVQTFDVDGDLAETGDPTFYMYGSGSTFGVDLTVDSVFMPANSVQASEISDEPGVASLASNSLVTVTSSSTHTTIATRTINCPASGYVLAIATCQAGVSHLNGTTSNYDFGVSDSPTSFPINQEVAWVVNAASPNGSRFHPITVHGLFQVSAGANQFYFLGRKIGSTAPNASINDAQLTLVYIPTSYGTVAPTVLGGGSDANAPVSNGLTPVEMEIEREQSILDYQAQVEAELAAIREEVALLRELREETAPAAKPEQSGDLD